MTILMTSYITSCANDYYFRGRIVGGHKVKKGKFPYVAAIVTEFKNVEGKSSSLKCTGSILTARWILTAAHCATHEQHTRERMRYQVGDVQLNMFKLKHFSEVLVHKDFIIHNDPVNGISASSDLCLAKTAEKIEFSRFINSVCLSSAQNSSDKCLIVGFGALTIPGDHTSIESNDVLHYATFYFNISDVGESSKIIFETQDKLPSFGDSGGPLVCDDKAVGVASSVSVSEWTVTATYMSTEHYRQWIEDTVQASLFENCTVTDTNGNRIYYSHLCIICILKVLSCFIGYLLT